MIDRNENEKRLIRKAISGESSAFGLLYDKYQPKIYRFIFFRVGYREEAEDLTHQVFLSAWQRIDNFRDYGFPISSWLFRIARNRVIDYYRTKKIIEPIDYIPEISQESDFNNIANKLNLEKIYSALQKLTESQREVIILRFIEGLSNREISDIIGKSNGAVRILQYRAISELKKILKDYKN